MRKVEKKYKRTNTEQEFPLIVAAHDNFGNKVKHPYYAQIIKSRKILKVGDTIEIQCEAEDPFGEPLQYSIARVGERTWTNLNKKSLTLEPRDVSNSLDIEIKIKSSRDDHAYGDFDDYIEFRYTVIDTR